MHSGFIEFTDKSNKKYEFLHVITLDRTATKKYEEIHLQLMVITNNERLLSLSEKKAHSQQLAIQIIFAATIK